MSRRLRVQRRSIRHSMVVSNNAGVKVTQHYFDTDSVANLFPERGKRTNAKMARLVQSTVKR